MHLNDLVKYSRYIGNDINLIQAAGGNSSIKIDNIMWVKASGIWLKNCDQDGFIPIDLNKFLYLFNTDAYQDIELKSVADIYRGNLRPSIETSVHAILPHKIIFHFHSINAITRTILPDSYLNLKKLLHDIEFIYLEYVKPGLLLAKKLQEAINTKQADIIILENHGIIIAGNDFSEVIELIKKVENRLAFSIEKDYKANVDYNFLETLAKDRNLRVVDDQNITALAFSDVAQRIINMGSLYPDNVVFLHNKISIIEDKTDIFNKVNIIKNKGVLVSSDLSNAEYEMLICLAKVTSKINANIENLKFLSEQDINELLNWDAETYRKNLEMNKCK